MASAFPHQPPVSHAPRKETNIVVDRNEPTDVLQVLSSESAQEILGTLKSEPRTASEIAKSIDQSVQNVSYHLDRLCEAELITPIETWYSEKGREMTVYALATEQLVVQFHDSDDETAGG
ncbi:ArsR/SmtB family transcription factor [Halorubrum laminariae]|uniref:ArsR/SmtB family transcription factor n=1 Tax=Halorubrum laminariae TaxID=1433523 RepID=A0ABD6C368_9EURY|nr:winged helix-turn-helix domain-containing protein [Halorubrum laminariae]